MLRAGTYARAAVVRAARAPRVQVPSLARRGGARRRVCTWSHRCEGVRTASVADGGLETTAGGSVEGEGSAVVAEDMVVGQRQWQAALDGPAASKFTVVESRDVPDYNCHVTLLRHEQSGGQLLSVQSEENNKVFGVCFRTPVDNDKGIPHILEHSVLCGSEKYPLREPFVELLKSSVQTFLNAFTYPDRTCYPVSSQNTQDFYNLVDVYMDAVFHPRLTPKVLQQEGWHYEVEAGADGDVGAADAGLSYKGVVFNEMKGVYSSAASIHAQVAQHALLPDTTYQYSSGGDPAAIPSLTFEEFKGFHSRLYHPSNSYVYFFGNDDPAKRLEIVDEYFQSYTQQSTDSSLVDVQPMWDAPRVVEATYPASSDAAHKHWVSLNWLMEKDLFEVETQVAWVLLDSLLLGNQASPLIKALNESGYGDDVIGHGVEQTLRQPVFSIGMQGVAEGDVDNVEQLILDVLQQYAEHGFDSDHLEAAVNSLQFMVREAPRSGYGLPLLLSVLPQWMHHGSPVEGFFYEEPLKRVCEEVLRDGSTLLQDLLKSHLLDNPHRLKVHLRPDVRFSDKREEEERDRLALIRDGLDGDEMAELAQQQDELLEHQNTVDPPEVVALVPTLELEDLGREALAVPREVTQRGTTTVLTHDQPTSKILYLSLGFNMDGLTPHQISLLPVFLRATRTLPTTVRSDVAMSRAIDTHTGGVDLSTSISPVYGSADAVGHVFMTGKALAHKVGDMTDIMWELLSSADYDNKEHVAILVREAIAGMESAMVSSGNAIVSSYLSGLMSKSGWLGSSMAGVHYLHTLRTLSDRLETDWDGVRADFEGIRATLLASRTLASVTADAATLTAAQPHLERLLDAASQGYDPSVGHEASQWPWEVPSDQLVGTAFLVPTQVNYVGKAARVADIGSHVDGYTSVIDSIVRTTYLWNAVRVTGGAYGASAGFDRFTGTYTATSYRDPNLGGTLDAFDEIATFLRDPSLTQEHVRKAIISTIGTLDAPLSPADKGDVSLSRYLAGITDDMAQERRDQIFETKLSDVHEFADRLDAFASSGIAAAVTSEEAYQRDDVARVALPNAVKVL